MFDMVVDADRVRGGTGYCLRTKDCQNFVFFVEDDSSVEINLGGMPGSRKVVAVDARKEYSEVNVGNLSAGWQTVDLGVASDWAIAVGRFEQ